MGVDFRFINRRGEQKIKGKALLDEAYTQFWQSFCVSHHRLAASAHRGIVVWDDLAEDLRQVFT